jgi:hypothetical protein
MLADDDILGAANLVRPFPHVEPQLGLPLGIIRAVALKAVVGQDRPHIARKINRWRRARLIAKRPRCQTNYG